MVQTPVPARRFRRFIQFAALVILSNVISCSSDGPTALQDSIQSVQVQLGLTHLTVGQQVQAGAIARNAAGAEVKGVTVSWSTSNPAVATVNGEGVVTAVAPGTSDIGASTGDHQATAKITVEAPPTQLSLTQQPSASVANATALTQQPIVRLLDAGNNPVNKPGIVVTATLTGTGAALSGTTTATTNAEGSAAFTNLVITGSVGARSLTFTAASLTAATSDPVEVTPGAPVRLSVTTQPSTTVANGAALSQQPAVQLQDVSNNPVAQAGVVVTAAISSGLPSLGGTLTATTAANGIATFSNLAITGSIGVRTLAFTAPTMAGATSAAVTVTAGPANRLAVAIEPSATVINGTAFAQQPTVQVRDASSNNVAQAGIVVVASIASGSGALSGTTTAVTTATGAATFTNLTLTGSGQHVLQFVAQGLSTAVSSPISVLAGAPAQLSFVAPVSSAPSPWAPAPLSPPLTAVNGVVFDQPPIVQLEDASRNAVTQAGIVVTVAISSGGGTLGGSATATTNADGQATFPNLSITGLVGDRVLSFSAQGLSPLNSPPIRLLAGSPTRLSIRTPASPNVVSGALIVQQPIIELQDASGNVVAVQDVPVTAAIATGGGTLAGTVVRPTDVNGLAVFTDLSLSGVAGSRVLSFSAPGLNPVTSLPVTVGAGAATRLAVTTPPPASAATGVPFAQQPSIQLQDASGNNVSQAGVTVSATIATGNGALTGSTSAATSASGVAVFTDLAISGSGSHTVQFSASGMGNANVVVAIGSVAATQLAIVTQPSAAAVAGAPLAVQPVIRLLDGSGTPATIAGVVVTAGIASGGGTLGGTVSAVTDATGTATFADLSIIGLAGDRTLAFSVPGLTASTSTAVSVGAGSAEQIAFTTQPATSAQSGQPLGRQPVVALRDAAGNAVPTAGVPVTASLNGGGTLGGTVTVPTDAAGVATFTDLAISGAIGSRSLNISATGLPTVSSGAIALAAGPAGRVAVVVQPTASVGSGVVFGQQPSVQLQDLSGNAVAQSGVVVTASIASGAGVLGGVATAVTNASGVAAFTTLSIVGTGAIQIAFSSPGLTGATSGTIAVGALAATQLAITTQPSATTQTGVVLARQPVVQLQNASNAVAQAGVTVTASISGSGAVLGGTVSVTTDANGTATFTDLSVSGPAGTRTIIFTASGLTGATSSAVAITAGSASRLGVVTQPPATGQSGVALTPETVVRIEDAAGNAVAISGVAVTIAIASGGGSLTGSTTVATDVNGVATFSDISILGATGSRTLSFTAAGLSPVTSTAVSVLPGVGVQLVLVTEPSTAAVNGAVFPRQPALQVRDGSGNNVSQSGVVVTAAVAAGEGTLGGTTTGTTNSSGVVTFTNLSISGSAGDRTIGFSSPGLSTATSGVVSITAASATKLGMGEQPSAVAVSAAPLPNQPRVQVQDPSGNAVAMPGVVVTASLASGSGTLAGTLAAVTDANGLASFANLAVTGTGSHAIAFTAPGLTAVTSSGISVSAAQPSQLGMVTAPSAAATSGALLPQQPAVRLLNPSGNPVSLAGVAVTVVIGSGGGAIGGTTTVTTDASGLATFSGLSLSGLAGDRTLSFTASGLTPVSSGTIALGAGPGAVLAIVSAPSATARTGEAFAQQPSLRVEDASGNPVATAGITVTASIASGAASLGGTTSATTNASGVATFADLSITGVTGARTLSFVAAGLSPVESGVVQIMSGSPASLAISTQPATTAQSGAVFATQPVIQLLDASGNAAAQAGVVVTASLASGGGTLSGDATAVTDAGGSAVFTDLSISGAPGARTIAFSATSLTPATSTSITVGAGVASQLAITTQPSASAANATPLATQPRIQLRDASGNDVAQAGVLVTASIATGGGAVSGATATTDAAGLAIFASLTLTGTVGNRTISFAASGLPSVTSQTVSVTAGAASRVGVVNPPPSAAQTGIPFGQQPVVALQDISGNTVAQAGVQVVAEIESGSGTLTGTTTAITDAAGTATFSDLAINGSGSHTLQFTSSGRESGKSPNVQVGLVVPSKLAILTGPPATAATGQTLTPAPVIQLQTPSSNPAILSGVVVTVAISSGGGTLLGTTSVSTTDGTATFSDLAISGVAGNRTLTFSSSGLTGVTTGTIQITAGGATGLILTTAPSATASSGIAFAQQPAVQVVDAGGNPVAQSGTVVTAAIASGGGTLDGTATATTNASGIATFTNLGITGTSGSRTLTFSATALSPVSTSAIVVSAGNPARLSISTAPSSSPASGVALSPQPAVRLEDAAGNPVVQAGVAVTASIASGGGVLSGTTTVSTQSSGIATFTNLVITGATGPRTLTFTATGLTPAVSATLTLVAGPASRLGISAAPSASAQSGLALPAQPGIRLEDQSGNVVAQAGVMVSAAIASGGGTLTGAAPIATNASGVATFTALTISGTSGSRTLSFSASGLSSVTSSAIALGAGASAALAITMQPSAVASSGSPFAQQPAVQLRDAAGNAVAQAGVVVTAAIASGSGSLAGTATATSNASGVATFTNLAISGTGTHTLQFTSGGLSAATSNSMAISAGTPTQLSITTQPSASPQNGLNFLQQPAIQLRDASAGAVAQAGVVITVAIGTGSGTLSGTLTATTDASGLATFTNLRITGATGARTLLFSAPGLGSVASATVNVIAGVPAKLGFMTTPSAIAQNTIVFAQQPVLQVQDLSGNATSQPGVLVTAAIASGGGTLNGTLTGTSNADGVVTFTGLSITGVVGIRTLSFTDGAIAAVTSGAIDLRAGPVTRIRRSTGPPPTVQHGVAFPQQPIVQAQDASQNPVAQPGLTITTAITVGGGTLLGTTTAVTNANGTATFTDLALAGTAGARELLFTGPSSMTSTGVTTLTAGPPSALIMATQPSTPEVSGSVFAQQPAVRLADGAGNPASLAGVDVAVAIASGGGVLSGTTVATTNSSGIATFTGLAITGSAGPRTLQFTAVGMSPATSATINITAAPSRLSMTTQPPATAPSGANFSQAPVVQLQDATGAAVGQAGVVVSVTISNGGGVLGGPTSASTNSSGVATFPGLSITGGVGNRTLTFSASGLTSVASTPISITAPASQLSITTQPPSSSPSTVALSPAPVIQLVDAGGTPVAQTGVPITATIASGSATLSGTTTVATNASGVATFSNLVVTGAPGTVTVAFNSSGFPSVSSGAITLTPAPASKLIVSPIGTQTAGTAFSVTVTLADATNAPVSATGADVVVTMTRQTGTGVLGGTVSGTIPVGSSSVTITGLTYTRAEGGVSLLATGSGEGNGGGKSGTSGTFSVIAGAATRLGLTVQPSATAQSGIPFPRQPVVQLLDASGNAVSQSGVVVTTAVASGDGTLGGTLSATTSGAGVATFTNLAISGPNGERTLSFSAPSLTAVTSETVTLATVAPALLEDFSTYTSTTNFLSNPRGIWMTSQSRNTSRIVLDQTVGYGGSTQSMRYDWPNNGPNCLDYQVTPGFLNLGSGRTHVWLEFVIRFGTTFKVNHGATGCAQEYKLAAMGDINGSGRWNVPEMQSGKFVMGYPGNDAGFSSTDPLPISLWDGQPHVFRVEAKLGTAGSPGIFRMWVDGVQVVNTTGFISSASHAQINIFGPGLNINQGPNISGMQMWWHRIAMYTSDPGW